MTLPVVDKSWKAYLFSDYREDLSSLTLMLKSIGKRQSPPPRVCNGERVLTEECNPRSRESVMERGFSQKSASQG
ncbi:hypothetical protein STEG23_031981, partial [Scotinomys teguina]